MCRLQVQGQQPNSGDSLTAWETGQKPYAAQSRQLGELIQTELNAVFGGENQMVEAPLAQLAPVTAPAVLVEAGFLTNSEDQQKLATASFRIGLRWP